jgi:hypothetical protein
MALWGAARRQEYRVACDGRHRHNKIAFLSNILLHILVTILLTILATIFFAIL